VKIAVTSQNFRTITQHAGKARRFLIFEPDAMSGKPVEVDRLDLPKEMSMHEFRGEEHPLFRVDQLVTGSCGQGFMQRMSSTGVKVVVTAETDPLAAVEALLAGKPLLPPAPHDHVDHGVMPS
jgi:predicted Fe-Mo cluster-binding NifX family protein